MENSNTNNLDVLSSIHEPYWLEYSKTEEYAELSDDITTDIAIVGGGIAGITSAFLLKNKGFKVAVIEAGRITRGTTGHTTAKITSQHGLIYNKLFTKFGEEKARQYAEANESAIKFIEDLVKEKNIDCDLCHRSAYVYTQSEEYIQKIEQEVEAASRLGIKAAYKEGLGLPFEIKAAVKFENQAQFHPLKYLHAIAKEIPGDGSNIYEHTKAIDVDDEETCTVTTSSRKKIKAKKVIIASHSPFYDGLGMYFARLYPERSYVIGVKIEEKLPEGMYINAETPTRSLRTQKYDHGEIVLVGGESHKTGSETNTNIHYENLAQFTKENFHLQGILYRWSTQDCMSMDDVPYAGYLTSNTRNVLVATGFGKWGNKTAMINLLKYA